jgi:hypothetical protein
VNRYVQAGGTLLILMALGTWSGSDSNASQESERPEEEGETTPGGSDADGGGPQEAAAAGTQAEAEVSVAEGVEAGEVAVAGAQAEVEESLEEGDGSELQHFTELNLPLPDGARLVEIEVDDEEIELVFATEALTPAEVLAFYEERLAAAGYQIEEVEDDEIEFSDERVEGEVEVEPSDGDTRFKIELEKKATESRS